jgi:hypothetical protein
MNKISDNIIQQHLQKKLKNKDKRKRGKEKKTKKKKYNSSRHPTPSISVLPSYQFIRDSFYSE